MILQIWQKCDCKSSSWLLSLQVEEARGPCCAHLPCQRGGSTPRGWVHTALPQEPTVGSPLTLTQVGISRFKQSRNPSRIRQGYFLFIGLQNMLREGSLPCLTVHLHSLDGSHADLRKSDMILSFSHLEIGTIPEKPHGNSTQWIDCFLGSFSSLLAPECFRLVWLPHQPSFVLALPVAAQTVKITIRL